YHGRIKGVAPFRTIQDYSRDAIAQLDLKVHELSHSHYLTKRSDAPLLGLSRPLSLLVHMRKTGAWVSRVGAVVATSRHRPSTRRVSTGATIPSSHRRAVPK